MKYVFKLKGAYIVIPARSPRRVEVAFRLYLLPGYHSDRGSVESQPWRWFEVATTPTPTDGERRGYTFDSTSQHLHRYEPVTRGSSLYLCQQWMKRLFKTTPTHLYFTRIEAPNAR